jgi:hypothetical protein
MIVHLRRSSVCSLQRSFSLTFSRLETSDIEKLARYATNAIFARHYDRAGAIANIELIAAGNYHCNRGPKGVVGAACPPTFIS